MVGRPRWPVTLEVAWEHEQPNVRMRAPDLLRGDRSYVEASACSATNSRRDEVVALSA
jgi:hypothetical protein